MEYSPKKLNEILIKNGFNFKKNYGQNFLIDENIINNIVKKAEIDKDTLVLEVGPGAGSLTYKLAQSAQKVICFEIDTKLKPILDEMIISLKNIDIYYEDFLKADINEKLKIEKYKKLYLVANLPYYITTPIIEKMIIDSIPVEKIVIMVQKEVGDRLKAKPGSKDYGSLTVFLNYYFEISKIMDVSKNVFIPKPNIDSAVIVLSRKKEKIYIKNEDLFFQLIRDSFKQKRKTIKNNLKNYNLEILKEILEKRHLDLTVRAEKLGLDVFADMANGLDDNND